MLHRVTQVRTAFTLYQWFPATPWQQRRFFFKPAATATVEIYQVNQTH